MKPFDVFEPSTLQEALDLLHEYGDKAKVLAGGTDLAVQMKEGKAHPQAVIHLGRLKDLAFVELTPGLRLGPMTLLTTMTTHFLFSGPLAILREAALAVGDPQIRNRATLGGNLANGSPSADSAPALLTLDATVRLRKKGGERTVRLEDFYRGPFLTQCEPDELITEISVPSIPKGGGTYLWMPKRTSVDETLVGVAAWVTMDSEKRICLNASLAVNSVSPVPMRLKKAETFLQGKALDGDHLRVAAEIAAEEVSPRSRGEYRKRIISVLVEKALEKAWERAEG